MVEEAGEAEEEGLLPQMVVKIECHWSQRLVLLVSSGYEIHNRKGLLTIFVVLVIVIVSL